MILMPTSADYQLKTITLITDHSEIIPRNLTGNSFDKKITFPVNRKGRMFLFPKREHLKKSKWKLKRKCVKLL